ncbi:conjugal transfer protein [Streptomyces sp. WMMC897]|nr:conjugal transfer protein [Streptomyces sp. WMMC897]MCZ7417570.1 conjugal transfer protein [Streptomyces sp. WMMC897]
MLATGIAGGIGTYTNVATAYGQGTAVGAVAAGEGATAVLALVLLGLTMLGQSAPAVVRAGLWLLPGAASAMAVTAADDPGQTVIYAITPMGMTVAAEGMAFLARRIVVHQHGRDVEAEARAAGAVRALAYHRARAAHHPTGWVRKASEHRSWRLARRIGNGDTALDAQLLTVQRERMQAGADAALGDMFGTATPPALPEGDRPALAPAGRRDVPEVVPAGARMLPVVARPKPVTPPVTEAVTSAEPVRVPDWTVGPFWDDRPRPVVAAAAEPRRVVTEAVTEMTTTPAGEMTAGELRGAARRLNRQAVKETGRPVTIDRLRTDLGLSRRAATDLRRQVVTKPRTS